MSSQILIVAFLASVVLLLGPTLPAQSGAVATFDWDDEVVLEFTNIDKGDCARLEEMGVSIDAKLGSWARGYTHRSRIPELEKLGYDMKIVPKRLGSRAGYHTHAQLTTELQAIEAAHPAICELYNIGNSVQGRELWFMKISDNVSVEEDEPEFKYISTMHGDEPVGMELCLNLINYLVDNYGSDPQVDNLINECEIWIMPLMNPDGYTSHSRYNSQGVDLNRDFPDRVTDPNNTTAGRAKETKNVMNWAFAHSSVLSANFHTGALVVNYPYDSDPNPWTPYSATPDDALFIQQSLTYSYLNTPMYNSYWFPQGITNGAAWYVIYGGMQDWNYVWMGCNEVTIELSDSKWPPYSQIAGLWNDNRDSMLAYMELCLDGVRGVVTDAVTGLPVSATVRVTGIGHDVFTDPDVGDYHRMLLPGTYSVEFSASGYEDQVVSGVTVGSGVATRVDVTLMPQGSNPPVPDVKVNGSDGPITITQAQSLLVQVSLDPGSLSGTEMDWWIYASRGSFVYSYKAASGNWQKGTEPERTYDGALMTVPLTTLINTSGLPAGTIDFFFAVDTLNGNYEGTYADTARVIVQ